MNESIFYFLNRFTGRSEILDDIFTFLANDLGYVLLVFLACLIFFKREYAVLRVREIASALFTAGFAWVVSDVLKNVFTLERPFVVLSDAVLLFSQEADYAFPSGHATFYFALAFALYFNNKTLGAFIGFGALIISVARVISGVHWPLDVLGGFLIGFIVSYLAAFLSLKLFKNS